MPAPNTPDGYRPYVDSDFTVRTDAGATRIFKLSSIKSYIDDEVQLSFSLVFTSPGDVLEQRIYRLSHPQLGEIDLFLVPIQQRKTGVVYEAGFNLLRDEAP